jgi:hypothetical protein
MGCAVDVGADVDDGNFLHLANSLINGIINYSGAHDSILSYRLGIATPIILVDS